MPDSDNHTTVSLYKGLRDDIKRMKRDGESYNDYIRRAVVALNRQEERQKSRFDFLENAVMAQSRLQVRMAAAQGLDKDEIPETLAGWEAWGGSNPFAPPEEAVTDVNRDEKEARLQAEKELEEAGEVGNDGPLHGHGRVAEEKIEERAREIMAEQATDDEGYMDSFDDNVNGGDH
jgi:Arc/MetJ-type ribon-helix-helix transcriptional regulator